MNKLSLSDFRALSTTKTKKVLPCLILIENEFEFYAGAAEDFIFIGDMHPAVRNQFRAKEALVRQGMPKPTKIYKEDVKDAAENS